MNAEYINDLVKQLRKPSSAIHKVTQKSVEWTVSTDIDAERAEAADVLEAQAKQIETLQGAVSHSNYMQRLTKDDKNEALSRIAELEAAQVLQDKLIFKYCSSIIKLEAENADFLEQLALRSESNMHKDMQEIMRINNQLNSRITELEAENRTLIKLQEPHYASSEVIPENQLEFMLYDTITERNDLKERITKLEEENIDLKGQLQKSHETNDYKDSRIAELWKENNFLKTVIERRGIIIN